MKLKIFKCLIILLFCFDAIDIYSQKIMIGNEVTNRPLTWDDFKGTPDANSPNYAVTYWGMIYQLNGIRTYGDSVHIDELMVESVSYTHLDVYKRQVLWMLPTF